LNVIISVLANANKSLLYNCNTDTEKTIFNYYLIEIIPILNKFYEKLIDIELPKTLNELVIKTKDKLERNDKLFSFRKKQNSAPTEPSLRITSTTPLYDYFRENSDEIIQVQSICFCASDISFIRERIAENIKDEHTNIFKNLLNYPFFEKTVKTLNNMAWKIDKIINEEKQTKQRKFFVIFKDKKNSQLEKLFRHKNVKINEKEASESALILYKIKDCIKKILKGLNVLNNTDYSYLNMASSNEKFLKAIEYTLEDLLEFTENENKIPLIWYVQFIQNNKESLDKSYLDNDLGKLYEELYNEETNILNELKSYSSIIITRNGMNLRCAEQILQKTKNSQIRLEIAKKMEKIENFIENDVTKVCIRVREKEDTKLDKDKSLGLKGLFGKKEGKPEPFAYISVVDAEKCHHKNITFMASIEGEKKVKINTHAKNVNEFISKFCYVKNNLKKEETKSRDDLKIVANLKKDEPKSRDDLKILAGFISEDIATGENTHQVYKAFYEYMALLKEKIKNDRRYIESTDEKERENEIEEFTNKIKEYIMKKIYNYVYPSEPLKEDNEFNDETKLLDWVTPENFNIKKLYANQLGSAISHIKKMDEAKSVVEKTNCIKHAQDNITNMLNFSTGKNKKAGADDITPIFQYIIIKAHPKRLISNNNYIFCFLDKNRDGDMYFLATQIQSAINYINNIKPEHINVTKEEYERNKEKAAIRHGIKKISNN
jgi:hypothetical protein